MHHRCFSFLSQKNGEEVFLGNILEFHNRKDYIIISFLVWLVRHKDFRIEFQSWTHADNTAIRSGVVVVAATIHIPRIALIIGIGRTKPQKYKAYPKYIKTMIVWRLRFSKPKSSS